MNRQPRRSIVAASFALAMLVAAACTRATVSPTPSPSQRAVPTVVASPPTVPIATATATATATPTPSPTLSPSPSPTTVADCVVKPQEGPLPSDRMTDVVVSSTDEADLITFVFGNASLPGPAGAPRGDLMVTEKPYTQSGSGQRIKMVGEHVIQVRFMNMSLSADTGDLTYNGRDSFKPNLPVLRHAVQFDAFEGQIGWYIGYDGPGCVTLGRDGNNVTVAFARP